MSTLRKRIILTLVISHLAALAVSLAYVALFSVSDGSSAQGIFSCRFKEIFNLYCPGCGGSRSLYYLLTFDFWRSFIYCPAILVTVGIIIALDIRAVKAFAADDLTPIRTFKSITFILIPIALLLNFIVRNALLLCGIDYIGDIINHASRLAFAV